MPFLALFQFFFQHLRHNGGKALGCADVGKAGAVDALRSAEIFFFAGKKAEDSNALATESLDFAGGIQDRKIFFVLLKLLKGFIV